MKRFLMISWLAVSLLIPDLAAFSARPAQAQNLSGNTAEPYGGEPLCLPGVYLQATSCLALGPAQVLTDMAKIGLTIPPRPLPATSPDPGLVTAPINYARVSIDRSEALPLFGSLDEAVAGTSPSSFISAGRIRWVSFIERQDVNGGHYLKLPSGAWVRASPGSYSYFQGLLFSQTPRNGFGWILGPDTPVMSSPGYNTPKTGRLLQRYNLVQVYAIEKAENANWAMIGINEWVEDRLIGRVTPNTKPPDGVDRDRWIEVNLEEQSIAVYDHNQLVYASLVSSGSQPFYTRPGLFHVYKKKELETMSGAFEADRSDYYYLEDVPWTMYFDDARALHGAYWHNFFGYPTSHGCVNLSPGDAHWIFDWAQDGEWVYVWDPSGQTPTDPRYYGAGGA